MRIIFLHLRLLALKDSMSLGSLDFKALLLALYFFQHKVFTSLSIQGGVSLSFNFFLGINWLTADQNIFFQFDRLVLISLSSSEKFQGIYCKV